MPPSPTPEPTPSPSRMRVWGVRAGVALVVAVYLVYSSFGVAHPILWGHLGHHTAEYMLRARNTLRFGLVTPTTAAGFEPPTPNFFYFHHPVGYHHLLVLWILLVGDHDWTASSLAALGGLLVIWALFALVRRYWSREAALLAIATWVGLPIICSFSLLPDPMLPTMACSILLVHAFLRYLDEPSRKNLARGAIAIVCGSLLMWELYFQTVMHAAFACVLALTPRGRRWRFGRWNAALPWTFFTGLAATATMSFHFFMVWYKGRIHDFFSSYGERSAPRQDDLAYLYTAHKRWLDILYPRVLLYIGVAWLVWFGVRLALRRGRARDQAVLVFLLLNLIYIYLFPGVSIIHLYRVFFFSSFFVLALTDLVVDLHAGVRWLLRDRPVVASRAALAAVVVAVAAYFALDVPHAYANLLESRVMMATHGQPGYNADVAKLRFAAEVAKRTGREDYVIVHDNLPRRPEFYYYVDRSNTIMSTLGQMPALTRKHPRALALLDAYPSPSEMKLADDLMRDHHGYRFDHYLMIDLRDKNPGVSEYEWQPQPMSPLYRWFVSHKYPRLEPREVTTIYTACVYAAIQKAPTKLVAEVPMPPPNHIDHAQCYYDFELVRARMDLANAMLGKIEGMLDRRPASLAPVGKVLGLRGTNRGGAELYLTIDQPPAPDLVFRWRLTPALSGGKAIVGEAKPQSVTGGPAPSELRAGYLFVDKLGWNAPPGKYTLTVEIGKPTPPPPRVATPRTPRPVPMLPPSPQPPPTPPPPVASATLGEIEIK